METILIITDFKKSILYESIITFYDLNIINSSLVDSIHEITELVVIIDVENASNGIKIANKLRMINPSSNILFINNFVSSAEHLFFTKIKGYGKTKILRWRTTYPDELLINIQDLIHPEYPSKVSDIAIIIPVYNEEARFEKVYNFIKKLKILVNQSFTNASIYFVNDGSKDNTQKLIDKLLEAEYEETNIISNQSQLNTYELQYNTRKAGTYVEGISSINASVMIFVDADDSFDIDDIAKIINILNTGYYDIVVGTKDFSAANRSFLRRLVSFFKRLLTKPLLPKGIYDSQTGLKGITSNCSKLLLPHLHENTGLAIDLEMMYIAKKLNFRALQLPVKCIDQEGSHVNIIKDSISFIKIILKLITVNRNISFDKNDISL
ncbi:undecaprenyl-phosphate 4-deoxy-4-formamido-L-arabinose transferase [Clostridium puniceum]|uniref:Undecaprenyl-phosphate 4-deoxy-4-formamido-L-arabinose transferase n=1 Tax=Clostridium puniceum TaxID=29367 RepID=A0A1S8TJH0_9CLOT|nr:glycosyltransferase [Clostridium puniceum]OOM77749.1 undecaprenyl-phosphate 4-deoxy-4-formamido-L-arabinose transferase [Clostridium puniceum]